MENQSFASILDQSIQGLRILLNGGPSEVLIIAPHGPIVKGEYKNDEMTGVVAEAIHKKTGWLTIINDIYLKPQRRGRPNLKTKRLDLNRRGHATMLPGYLETLKMAVDAHQGRTLVIWIHGMSDENVPNKIDLVGAEHARDSHELDALIGYGQGGYHQDYLDHFTAKNETVSKLKEELRKNGMGTYITKKEATSFRGRHPEGMNQWFVQRWFSLEQVESIQIEIRKEGFRKDHDQCEKTAEILSKAIKAVITPTEKQESLQMENPKTAETESPLVNEAFDYLKDIFRKHFHEAMLEAGRYIVEKFYDGNFEHAREKKPVDGNSLRQLILRLQNSSGEVPSKTWIYDAVKLAVDENTLADSSTYKDIGHSQKVLLTHISDEDRKERLIKETAENDYTIARLRERIKETSPLKRTDHVSVENVPDNQTLEQLPRKRLEALFTELDKRESLYRDKYNQFKDDKARVLNILEKKPKNKTKARKIGFRDWTNIACNINIQSGCSNDCLYCYAKIQAYRRKQMALGTWTNEIIRKAEVDRPRKFYSGLVGFPSTHDITLQNVSDYLNVLGKLLRAGNEVLIVSKPRLECIQKICKASQFFKDKILFRFTIGANDDDILGFWEPNAPTYAERKEALKYAFDSGFRTSASIEPMLDSTNVVSLVNDLAPLISEDIWIGKMNHIKGFAKDVGKDLKIRLKQIEEGQTKDRLETLHETLKNNPKVKWKTGS